MSEDKSDLVCTECKNIISGNLEHTSCLSCDDIIGECCFNKLDNGLCPECGELDRIEPGKPEPVKPD